MACKNCGTQLPDNTKFCPKCGTENSAEELNISAAGVERAVPRGFSAKENIIIIIIAAVLLIGGGITAIAVVNSHSASSGVSDKLQLAERYLNEQNYEQAIIEYQKILEIEPMNVDAYLGLADAYIGKGKPDKAISALRDGLERTKDDKIKTRLVGELLNRAQDHINSGDYEKAIADLQSVLKLDSKNADAYLKLAEAYLGLGQKDKALEILREGLEKTGDARIQSRIDKITAPQEPTAPVYGSMGSVTILGEEYDIATTKALDLTERDITNEQLREIVSEIEKLTNLKSLILRNNRISDIMPLANLTNLTRLALGYNQISDVTPMENLINLTYLDLGGNQISDITPLAKLTGLTSLFLGGNQISDITPIANLIHLTNLNLWYNQISDITALSKCSNFTNLSLSNNNISDITSLAHLTNLTSLGLRNNQINNITPISNLTNLRNLYLIGNQVSDEDIERLKTKLPNCDFKWEDRETYQH